LGVRVSGLKEMRDKEEENREGFAQGDRENEKPSESPPFLVSLIPFFFWTQSLLFT